MKRFSAAMILGLLSITVFAQKTKPPEKSLLWKISGNGLSKPSYLFGTIHLLCKDDALLSDSMKSIIARADEVYFEVDLDNMMEMMGMLKDLKMRGDTTLKDLLTTQEYEQVKNYFETHASMLPFSVLETYKPILAASMMQQNSFKCESTAMEQVIMAEAKRSHKRIQGLETMGYQAAVLDQIPYQLQARQLVDFIVDSSNTKDELPEFEEMMKAYNDQDLEQMEKVISKSDLGMANYSDVLLYQRNRNWVTKLKNLLPSRSVLVAVGAGHLPGDQGVINLLRKAGYKVTAVKNERSAKLI